MCESPFDISIAGRLDERRKLVRAVDHFGRQRGLPNETLDAVQIALDEVVSNIVFHGGRADGLVIRVWIAVADEGLHVVVEDNANAFNPLSRQEDSLEGGVRGRRLGGLGIRFLRAVMDELRYRREGGCNVIEMHKRLAPPSQGNPQES